MEHDNKPSPKELVAIGGVPWKSGNNNRIYFNKMRELLGLEVHFHPAPKNRARVISHAFLRGEQIPVDQARDLYELTRAGKFWYDIDDQSFAAKGLTTSLIKQLVEAVHSRVIRHIMADEAA